MRIVITDCDHGFFEPELKVVNEAGESLVVCQCRTPAEVISVAQEADGLLCQYLPITKEVMEALPRLRVVGRYGVGVDNVDLQAASSRGIQVVYAPNFCTEEVADHTMALILALSRQLVPLHLWYTQDLQGMADEFNLRFNLLTNVQRTAGKILGLIGFGRIGREVGRRARSFGYQVIVSDPYLSALSIRANGGEPRDLDDLLRRADVVSLHCPLTAKTRRLIGARELGLMKSSAHLVNTSRGPLIDEAALVDFLRECRLAGAALDVTEIEPLSPNHPLLRMKNVILTPHVAFYSRESILQLKEQMAHSMIRALNKSGDFELANPEVLNKGPAEMTRA